MKLKKILAVILLILLAIALVTSVAIKTEQILTSVILKSHHNAEKTAPPSSLAQKNFKIQPFNIISKNLNEVSNTNKSKAQKFLEPVTRSVYETTKPLSPVLDLHDTSNTKNISKKVIYLTIDDGPSSETPKILEILEKEGIKATFFVVGYNCVKYPNFLKQIYQKGHLIGNHSYSHKYKVIYKSFKNFADDFNKAQDVIYQITGIMPKYYRFPGGSLNKVSPQIKKFFDKNKVIYIDWNAITGDSSKNHEKLTYKDIIKMTFATINNKNQIVLLMHDSPTKKNVIEALPYIIKTLKSKGYVFETVDKMPKPLQFKTKAASSH
ncbi:polysaccharide deacetylase [Caldicellulosiruptor saccharolyticus DSM 8903]|uniref:Polysaccharide deacetylase n=1 Tax=Caldicellulosiruptor saccharolyticus (strain ATCC 43494 / DSM 8903 / Tp8T 6331) TaxID=351627 RepID=A4XM14_CALS8|nr:polysaccharide deacetylase family protein [Caldicellulosiruptor saccharolyticus]ABP67949.1 polysaccharide deacetylase [Caldicellulosiruptor saccharolyticus DSM 8903]